ncbi:MAG TPA: PQQ-dependent sugar dehydrogenase, partial [Verrucomicrobiales bacterium]|nr:PQQ-dependent sugar dehydrogenase [Verrucomicrobiales bacterium]
FARYLPFLLFPAVLRAAEPIDPLRYEKEVIVSGCADPMQMSIAGDGRIFFVERAGAVKLWEPKTRRTVTLGTFPAPVTGDTGALGLVLARDFAESGNLYVYRVPLEKPDLIVLSRFTLKDGKLEAEKRVLEVPLGKGPVQSHCGGGLAWDAAGNLLIGVGDNMAPQDLPAVHPTDIMRDSRGTAGNSKELRGKILRITPKADGSYSTPPGNMFTDPAEGRPEVFAMGVRNPFRVACDAVGGFIAWGDVGGNVKTSLDLGPEGFDEINVTRTPGFFGWPYCSGPNAPWRTFDPKTQKPAGDFYDPLHIVNDSPRNTGLKQLPPARPASFYYTSTPSKEWPFAGSGGRSVTGGVFYRPVAGTGDLRLPEDLRGAYIFGEWMRNWIAVARLKEDGSFSSVEPFLTHLRFRRPTDFQVGPEGALYVAECGDRWTGNTDSQITRVIYRRGNRPPVAVLEATGTAGKVPLTVKFDARKSSDPDKGAELRYSWSFGDGGTAEGPTAEHTFTAPGVWPVLLTVFDKEGLFCIASRQVMAGNEAPQVSFTTPADGGFFDYGQSLPWKLSVNDAEDGPLPAEKVLVQMERRNRASGEDDSAPPPGLALMRRTTCFACHSATEKSAGPPYATIAAKYANDATAKERLAAKIISGGSGVWGELPMPPHPQHTPAEAALMVDWVLSLSQRQVSTLPPGLEGQLQIKQPRQEWGRAENSVVALMASAVDKGVGTLPPQRGETEIVLRARRQRASFFDRGHLAAAQDNLDQGGVVARIAAGGWMAFDRIRLSETRGLRLQGWPQGSGPLTITIHAGTADGPVLGTATASPGGGGGKPKEIAVSFSVPQKDGPPQPVVISMDGAPGSVLDVMWVDFQPPAK